MTGNLTTSDFIDLAGKLLVMLGQPNGTNINQTTPQLSGTSITSSPPYSLLGPTGYQCCTSNICTSTGMESLFTRIDGATGCQTPVESSNLEKDVSEHRKNVEKCDLEVNELQQKISQLLTQRQDNAKKAEASQAILNTKKHEYAIECRAYLKLEGHSTENLVDDTCITRAQRLKFYKLTKDMLMLFGGNLSITDFEEKINTSPFVGLYQKLSLYDPKGFTIYSSEV
jgi:hypothetical protein